MSIHFTFFSRYAYHLRRWALAESGAWEGTPGVGSVRLTLQPAGAGPRATISLHHTDLVAHLRAHVHVWWEKQVLHCQKTKFCSYSNFANVGEHYYYY